jgi:hypothetical protein
VGRQRRIGALVHGGACLRDVLWQADVGRARARQLRAAEKVVWTANGGAASGRERRASAFGETRGCLSGGKQYVACGCGAGSDGGRDRGREGVCLCLMESGEEAERGRRPCATRARGSAPNHC